MSAYITKLEIPGFSGSGSLWKSFVNSFESGGGGGGLGSMRSDCFTLDLTNQANPNSGLNLTRVQTAEFQTDQILLNVDIKSGISPIEAHYLCLTVTPAYEGLFPDTIIFRFISQFNTQEGLLAPSEFYVWAVDVNGIGLGTSGYGPEYDIYDLLDSDNSGYGPMTLTYSLTINDAPYESPGLYKILFYHLSSVPW